MSHYFVSDIHLRLDRPELANRFAEFVSALSDQDTLTIGGDLCDFWFASRQRRQDPLRCPGLRALADFTSSGGQLTIVLGNHDGQLGELYARVLGATIADEPLTCDADGNRIHMIHGHRTSGRSAWKQVLESRLFLFAFSALPNVIAVQLERLLNATNAKGRAKSNRRFHEVYREYADRREGDADLFLFGHVHAPLDEVRGSARIIVLGGWEHEASYLRIDPDKVEFTST